MPELPEVEFARGVLRRAIAGRTIVRVRVLHPSLAARLPAAARRRLTGRTVRAVERRGKYQLVSLDDGRTMVVHFRMSGDWSVGRAGERDEPYARAVFDLDDGSRVSLIDPRALATLALVDDVARALPPLGPEPGDRAFTPQALAASLRRRRGAIKPALLDQRVVAGLGNIYAVEALWVARIDPRVPACRLGPARLARLVVAARAVLAAAGRERWKVYDREGEPCARCGHAVRRIVQAGRSTYFCSHCQRR